MWSTEEAKLHICTISDFILLCEKSFGMWADDSCSSCLYLVFNIRTNLLQIIGMLPEMCSNSFLYLHSQFCWVATLPS